MNQHLRLAIDHLREGVQVIDPDWRYLYLNETAARQGRSTPEALVGRRMQECYPGIEQTAMFRVLERVRDSGRAERFRNEFAFADGEKRWFDLRIEPVPAGICVLSIDVTDELRVQERLREVELQLQQAQKMEAVGRLAGGIAHDFNNQLTVILGFTQMLLESEPSDAARRDLLEIEAASQRSAALIRQLLALGKRQVLDVEPVILPDLVESITRLLERLLGDDIECDLRIHPETAPVLADRGQLEHVITNLAVNARDAMPAGGRLTIATRTTSVEESDPLHAVGLGRGRYTVLSVTDTGHGMDAATRARIFEPFFTTKEPGRGSGFGLAMVYGIVRQLDGHVVVESQPLRGTTFDLYFPAMERSRARSAPAAGLASQGD